MNCKHCHKPIEPSNSLGAPELKWRHTEDQSLICFDGHKPMHSPEDGSAFAAEPEEAGRNDEN
jgi:hypothetical protein